MASDMLVRGSILIDQHTALLSKNNVPISNHSHTLHTLHTHTHTLHTSLPSPHPPPHTHSHTLHTSFSLSPPPHTHTHTQTEKARHILQVRQKLVDLKHLERGLAMPSDQELSKLSDEHKAMLAQKCVDLLMRGKGEEVSPSCTESR